MTESTPIVAFEQHAATTVAAVRLPGQRTPALHALASDSPTILRLSRGCVGKVRSSAVTRPARVASNCSER
jgi:hypothetical protein